MRLALNLSLILAYTVAVAVFVKLYKARIDQWARRTGQRVGYWLMKKVT